MRYFGCRPFFPLWFCQVSRCEANIFTSSDRENERGGANAGLMRLKPFLKDCIAAICTLFWPPTQTSDDPRTRRHVKMQARREERHSGVRHPRGLGSNGAERGQVVWYYDVMEGRVFNG